MNLTEATYTSFGLVRDMMAAELPVLEANGLSMWGYSVLVALDRSAIRTQAALRESSQSPHQRAPSGRPRHAGADPRVSEWKQVCA